MTSAVFKESSQELYVAFRRPDGSGAVNALPIRRAATAAGTTSSTPTVMPAAAAAPATPVVKRQHFRCPLRRSCSVLAAAITALAVDDDSDRLFGWGDGVLHCWSTLQLQLLWAVDDGLAAEHRPITQLAVPTGAHCVTARTAAAASVARWTGPLVDGILPVPAPPSSLPPQQQQQQQQRQQEQLQLATGSGLWLSRVYSGVSAIDAFPLSRAQQPSANGGSDGGDGASAAVDVSVLADSALCVLSYCAVGPPQQLSDEDAADEPAAAAGARFASATCDCCNRCVARRAVFVVLLTARDTVIAVSLYVCLSVRLCVYVSVCLCVCDCRHMCTFVCVHYYRLCPSPAPLLLLLLLRSHTLTVVVPVAVAVAVTWACATATRLSLCD